MNVATTELFNKIRDTEYIKIHVLRRMFLDILSIFSANARLLGGNIEKIKAKGDNYHYQYIMALDNLNDIESWFIEFG